MRRLDGSRSALACCRACGQSQQSVSTRAGRSTVGCGRLLRTVHDVDSADGRGPSRAIVFCASKRGCEQLRNDLKRRGYSAESLHGDKSQQERDWALQQFKTGAAPLLIATDVPDARRNQGLQTWLSLNEVHPYAERPHSLVRPNMAGRFPRPGCQGRQECSSQPSAGRTPRSRN